MRRVTAPNLLMKNLLCDAEGRHFAGVADFGRNYDVAPDGRFLMIKEANADQSSALPHIVVVQHWFEDLKRLVPATR